MVALAAVLRATGTSHLVAISGLHIGFVAGLAALLCGHVWRRLAWRGTRAPLAIAAPKISALGAAVCAACYAALAGFNVPAQRAFWMLAVVALAYVCGRRPAASLVWCWVLAFVLIADPWAVISPGFWLSFGAVVAILFAIEARGRAASTARHDDAPVDAFDWNDRGEWPTAHARDDAEFAAAIARIERAFPHRTVVRWRRAWRRCVSGARIQYAVTLALAPHFASPLWHLPQPDAFALVAACIGVVWALLPRGWPLRFAAPLLWLPLAASLPRAPDAGTFRVIALDVGQGSALVVQTAHHALLFDAGPGPESTHAGERIVAPYLLAAGVRTLDALMVSHSDSDHAGGAQTLRCVAGQRWNWDGVEFRVLWPPPAPLAGKPNA